MDFLGIFFTQWLIWLPLVGGASLVIENIMNVVLIAVFISGLDFLIIKKYLKLDKKRSLKLAIWMGIITNPGWIFLLSVL